MKFSLLSFLFFVIMTTSATAGSINYTTDTHWYKRWPDQMEGIVAFEEDSLNQYLGKKLECRLVQLQFNNHRSPTLFKAGEFNLTLKAECNKKFSDFKMGVNYGYSNGEPVELILSFLVNGRHVEEVIQFKE